MSQIMQIANPLAIHHNIHNKINIQLKINITTKEDYYGSYYRNSCLNTNL